MSLRDLLPLKSRPTASGAANGAITVADESSRQALLGYIAQRDQALGRAFSCALAEYVARRDRELGAAFNAALAGYARELNQWLGRMITDRDQQIAFNAAAAVYKEVALKGARDAAQPLKVQIVNPEQIGSKAKIMTVTRDPGGKMTGVAVASV